MYEYFKRLPKKITVFKENITDFSLFSIAALSFIL